MSLPTGTVSFLFTDIESSTRMWETYPDTMRVALAEHDALMRARIEEFQGYVFKTIGDAFCAAFHTAPDAVAAGCAMQRDLLNRLQVAEGVFIKVRMAVHTGQTDERDGDYFGPTVNRVARLLSIGHGGQLLLSSLTVDLTTGNLPPDASVLDMGNQQLKDLQQPEHVWQFCHPDLPTQFERLNSLNVHQHNLPVQTTSFIGRETQIAEVKQLLAGARLLTLTGAGGCGKTRLALQVAADLLGGAMAFESVWLVEFAPLADASLVPQTLASVLNVPEEPGRTMTQTLIDFLKPKKWLLVLDNCEHVLTEAAQLTNALIRACPHVKILASSREGLAIQGETIYRIPMLSLPSPKPHITREQVFQFEAVRLFVERATAVAPTFNVTNQNAPALASVCRHLDGIPLAIELAAARVRALPIEQINTRLSDRFRLLTGGNRAALPRQQTLRALIDWSYDLLNDQEKTLLCRLSVFAGGWTLETAEAICAGGVVEDWEIIDFLTSLVDKSLAVYEERDETARYRLLETVRQYSDDRLRESGEAEETKARHRDHFLMLAEEAKDKLIGPEQAQWLDNLDTENDNLRAALDFCLEAQTADGADAGLRMAESLWRFWYSRGHYTEGRERCTAILTRPDASEHPLLRAYVLARAGTLAYAQGDYAAARLLLEESLASCQELEDKAGAANALNLLGALAWLQGDHATARERYEECLSLQRELGDPAGLAKVLGNMGAVTKDLGNYDEARRLQEECLAIQRRLGNKQGIATALGNVAVVEKEQRNVDRARTLFEESLTIGRELGNRQGIAIALVNLGPLFCKQGDLTRAYTCLMECLTTCEEISDKRVGAFALEGCAHLALTQGNAERAVRLYSVAEALRAAIGSPIPSFEQQERDTALETLRASLGDHTFEAAWASGHYLTWEEAIALAQEETA